VESGEFVVFCNGIQSLQAVYRHSRLQKPATNRRLPFALSQGEEMPKYVIEREIPGAGSLTPEQLHAISQTSCGVLRKMGPEIQWIESYVTDDKVYCVYFAQNEEMVREHAKQGGFPANKVSQVRSIIDPTTSE
jgi:hypothetical protein